MQGSAGHSAQARRQGWLSSQFWPEAGGRRGGGRGDMGRGGATWSVPRILVPLELMSCPSLTSALLPLCAGQGLLLWADRLPIAPLSGPRNSQDCLLSHPKPPLILTPVDLWPHVFPSTLFSQSVPATGFPSPQILGVTPPHTSRNFQGSWISTAKTLEPWLS